MSLLWSVLQSILYPTHNKYTAQVFVGNIEYVERVHRFPVFGVFSFHFKR